MKNLMLTALALLTAANAFADDKVLVLKVGRSQFYTKDIPTITLQNGPLAEDERSIALEIDQKSFQTYLANYKVAKQVDGFFRETRNFRDARAEIQLRNADGTVTTQSFALAPNAPEKAVIPVSDYLWEVAAAVTGKVDVYKCFDHDTCVLEETRPEKIIVEDHNIRVKHNFRTIVACRENAFWIDLAVGVDHPQIKLLRLHRTVSRRYLKVAEFIPAKSKPVVTGADFTGFTTTIGHFGLYPWGDSSGTTMEVTYDNGKFSIVTRYKDGKTRSTFDIRNCANFP